MSRQHCPADSCAAHTYSKFKICANLIMGLDYFSDYASAPSSSGGSPWGSTEESLGLADLQRYLRDLTLDDPTPSQRANSLSSLSSKPAADVMEEFRLNGSDAPYDPDDDDIWGLSSGRLTGMGPAVAYLRQKSWPAPDASPAAPLPPPSPPLGMKRPAPQEWRNEATPLVTVEQRRVLQSLPTAVVFALLRELGEQRAAQDRTNEECRFCKNNGERESYYRSHSLKDARGRVRCPVLRAFVCRRCGARGDAAHTIKYCPLSTDQERQKSAAMMRSVRLASGRKRLAAPSVGGAAPRDASPAPQPDEWSQPLDPVWAALEKKLLE